MARTNRRAQVYRQRLISRKAKTRKVDIVSRKGQPQIRAEVRRLKKAHVGGRVSSSWIANLEWDDKRNIALMLLIIKSRLYDVHIKFKLFEEWFYAHSKGTFFNKRIKGKYKVTRSF